MGKAKTTSSKGKLLPKTTRAAKSKPAKNNTLSAKVGKNGPTLVYLKEMAKDLGLSNISRLPKGELIHAIQLAEGNTDCYGRIVNCTIADCLFHPSCQPAQLVY